MPGFTPKKASDSAGLRQGSCSRSAAGRPGAANAAWTASPLGRVAAAGAAGFAAGAGGASRSAHAASRRSRATVIEILIAHTPPPTAGVQLIRTRSVLLRDTAARA